MPERDVRINILKGYERKIEIGRGTYTYPIGHLYLKQAYIQKETWEIKSKNDRDCMPHVSIGTVPAFNSCTKCLGSPAIIYDCRPNCHQVS